MGRAFRGYQLFQRHGARYLSIVEINTVLEYLLARAGIMKGIGAVSRVDLRGRKTWMNHPHWKIPDAVMHPASSVVDTKAVPIRSGLRAAQVQRVVLASRQYSPRLEVFNSLATAADLPEVRLQAS